jgi:hypothetical protein
VLLGLSFAWAPSVAHAEDVDPLNSYRLKQLLKDTQGDVPGEEGGFSFRDVRMEPGRARIQYNVGKDGELDVVLVALESEQKAYAKSRSFKIYYPAHPSHSSVDHDLLMKALDAIVKRVQDADPGKLTLPALEDFRPEPVPTPSPEETKTTAWQGGPGGNLNTENTNHLRFGFLLLFLCLAFLPVLIKRAWATLQELGQKTRYGLWGTLAVGGILRLFVIPHIVVTMYMGYLLTEQAVTLHETFRYGVGAQVLWNTLFHIAPADHASLIGLNAVLGTLNLLLWAAVLHRAGLKALGVLLATALMALMPMVLWSDGSDSLTVVVFFWNLGAVLFAQEFLRTKNMVDLWGAVLWLGMAAHTRPEQMLFGPLLVLTIVAAQAGPKRLLERLKAPISAWLIALIGYTVLIWPQLIHAMNRRARLKELDSWPHELWDVVPDLPRLLQSENALLKSHMTPMLLLPLALVALVVARNWQARRFRLSLMSLGLVWMIFYYIDLSSASLPRLHIVLLVPCCIVTADLLSDVWEWRPPKFVWAGRSLVGAALLVISLQIPATARWLWQDTNEWQEDRMYRAATALLPGEPHQLVHYSYGDPEPVCFAKPDGQEHCGPSHTHEHHPDYLVEAPQGQTTVFGITEFSQHGALDNPTYFYLGMRCYSQLRPVDAPVPERYFAPACAAFMKGYELEAILEQDLPNRGDFGLHYYSQEKTFKLGLYRVKARL